ncbi:MAG: CHASE3 domain-containing protein, partial [Gaiellaceae bacterium]
MLNQQTSVRGYVITADPKMLAPYRQGHTRESQELAQIAASAASDPRIPQQLVAVRLEVNRLQGRFVRQIALVGQGAAGQRRARAQIVAGRDSLDRFRRLALALETDAGRVVERARSEQHETFVETVIFLACAGALVLAIAGLLFARIPARLYRLYRAEEDARRAAEEGAESARALAHVAEAVVLSDDDDLVRYWNPAAARLFGSPSDAAIGRPIDVVAPALAELTADAGPGARPIVLQDQ